jgi:hypothetical protein
MARGRGGAGISFADTWFYYLATNENQNDKDPE